MGKKTSLIRPVRLCAYRFIAVVVLIPRSVVSYLAVKSALMCEADYLFIREWPQKVNWPDILCETVVMVRKRFADETFTRFVPPT